MTVVIQRNESWQLRYFKTGYFDLKVLIEQYYRKYQVFISCSIKM